MNKKINCLNWAILAVCAQILDIASTYVMFNFGIKEANPIWSSIADSGMFFIMVLAKIICMSALIFVLYVKKAKSIIIVIFIIGSLAPMWNTFLIFKNAIYPKWAHVKVYDINRVTIEECVVLMKGRKGKTIKSKNGKYEVKIEMLHSLKTNDRKELKGVNK